MILAEVASQLGSLPESGILFAERRGGHFEPTSEVFVLELSDSELGVPTSEVAAYHAPGMEYFIEVAIAREIAEARPDAVVDTLIYYAENDAYPG